MPELHLRYILSQEVIPIVSWGDESTFDFCFSGIEKGSAVAGSNTPRLAADSDKSPAISRAAQQRVCSCGEEIHFAKNEVKKMSNPIIIPPDYNCNFETTSTVYRLKSSV